MLSHIVRPLVQTQVRLLANSQTTRITLVETIVRWLSYLGLSAMVTQIRIERIARGECRADWISVSLIVGKPESCDLDDRQKILANLSRANAADDLPVKNSRQMSAEEQRQLACLFAYLVQIGNHNSEPNWERIASQLEFLGLGKTILAQIKSALKVPQSLDLLLEKLDPDLAAIALLKKLDPDLAAIALLKKLDPDLATIALPTATSIALLE